MQQIAVSLSFYCFCGARKFELFASDVPNQQFGQVLSISALGAPVSPTAHSLMLCSLRDSAHCARLDEGNSSQGSSRGAGGKPVGSICRAHALYQLPDGTAWLEHSRMVDAAGLVSDPC